MTPSLTSEWEGVVALAFGGDDTSSPLLALLATTGGCRALRGDGVASNGVLVGIPAASEPRIVAELDDALCAHQGGAAASKAQRGSRASHSHAGPPWAIAAVAWDATREALWIACPMGLLALGLTRRH